MQCEMLPILEGGGPVDAGTAADAGPAADAGTAADASVGDGGAAAGHAVTFSSAKNYPPGGHPARVAVADMNGDGHLDIVMTSQSNVSATTWQVNVLLNVGDGTFAAPASYSLSGVYSYLAVGDLNGDGKPDVAVTIFSSGDSVDVLLNKGDGTLAAPSHHYFAGPPQGLVLADVDGNGRNDLVVAFVTFAAQCRCRGSPEPGRRRLLRAQDLFRGHPTQRNCRRRPE